MYIGKYSPNYFLQSYATIQSNCMNIGKGKYEWNGIDGVGTGSSCSAARANYCAKYGKDGKCYGDIGGPAHDDPSIPSQQSRQPSSSPSGGGTPDANGCKKKACPPPPNKQDIVGYWNQASCEFENLTCGALPSWGFSVIVGLGGVLLLGLLVKRR